MCFLYDRTSASGGIFARAAICDRVCGVVSGGVARAVGAVAIACGVKDVGAKRPLLPRGL